MHCDARSERVSRISGAFAYARSGATALNERMSLTNRLSAPLGTHNAILRARARTHFVKDFPGPLSIKSVTTGSVAWKSGGRELVVDRDSFLVLHDGEPYSMN